MKNNEYAAAEVVEIGEAQSVVLGDKSTDPDIDFMEPWDRRFVG
jgi:hypothetical protein